jgi:hypothetical protein
MLESEAEFIGTLTSSKWVKRLNANVPMRFDLRGTGRRVFNLFSAV